MPPRAVTASVGRLRGIDLRSTPAVWAPHGVRDASPPPSWRERQRCASTGSSEPPGRSGSGPSGRTAAPRCHGRRFGASPVVVSGAHLRVWIRPDSPLGTRPGRTQHGGPRTSARASDPLWDAVFGPSDGATEAQGSNQLPHPGNGVREPGTSTREQGPEVDTGARGEPGERGDTGTRSSGRRWRTAGGQSPR